jgi:hypothetical protein
MKTKAVLKLIAGNVIVLCSLMLAANIAAGTWLDWRAKHARMDGATDPRAELPAYADHAYAKQIFHDFYLTKHRYSSYDAVRLEPFSSPTANIGVDGLRMTPGAPRQVSDHLDFFGGSTAWGTGVDDAHTIPALMQLELPNTKVTNHGQSGFVSLQGVAALTAMIAVGKPLGTVVFYDGINDIFHLCQSRIPLDGHSFTYFLEEALRSYLEARGGQTHRLWTSTVGNFVEFSRYVAGAEISSTTNIAKVDGDRCGSEANTAVVADVLWRNWLSAKALTEANGGRFIAILQPISSVGAARRDYLPPSGIWDEVYLQAYEHLHHRIETEGKRWAYDLSSAFDGPEPLYIDQMHVTARGNEIMAKAILLGAGVGTHER